MKPKGIFKLLLLPLFLIACGTEDVPTNGEYIVVHRTAVPPDSRHFQAIEIHTGNATPVFSIRETNGGNYLPTMSRLPECNRKVVAGFFEDSIFVTTKILRDTTVPTVGR